MPSLRAADQRTHPTRGVRCGGASDLKAPGHAVLEAVLSHSAAERSATHTGIAAHKAANSMVTLIPIYELIAPQLSEDRWDPTGDDIGAQIRQSDAWPKLTAILRNVSLTSLDPDQLLLTTAWVNGRNVDWKINRRCRHFRGVSTTRPRR